MNFSKNKNNFLKTLVLSMVFILSLQTSAFANVFNDIDNHWARDNILKAHELGIIHGDENKNVNPNANISRIEFIKIINKSLHLESLVDYIGSVDSRYSDVSKEKWFYGEVKIAEDYGYLNNVFDENYLSPDREITREEAATLLNQAVISRENIESFRNNGGVLNKNVIESFIFLYSREESDFVKTETLKSLKFNDSWEINRDYLKSIKALSDEKIINGYEDNSFKPKAPIKKSEAIIIILKSTGNEVKAPLAKVVKTEASKVENKIEKQDANYNFKLVNNNGIYFIVDKNTNENVKKSQFENGVVKIGENSYLIKENGELDRGFVKIANKTYYADAEKGFVKGWKEIDGGLYYFSPMDQRMYADGVFSTGTNVHWFGKDGKLKTGKRPAGYMGKKSINWLYPTKEELSNSWLEGDNKELRFRGQEIANYAAKHEGLPFKWYGNDLKDKSGVYCCGIVYSTYKAFGIHVPGPDDCNMYGLNGYEMVKAQYTRVGEFGGYYLPSDYSKLNPGDLAYLYSPKMPQGYNHAAIFIGYNGKTPMIVHATLANGLVTEEASICTNKWGYKPLKFLTYNTEKNVGIGNVVPE